MGFSWYYNVKGHIALVYIYVLNVELATNNYFIFKEVVLFEKLFTFITTLLKKTFIFKSRMKEM